jgi:hypothetical protein
MVTLPAVVGTSIGAAFIRLAHVTGADRETAPSGLFQVTARTLARPRAGATRMMSAA